MLTLILVIGLALTAIVFFLIPALFGQDEPSTPAVSDSDDSHLIGACSGDRAKAERLIEYEVRQNATLSRSQAVSAALIRLQKDR